MWFEGDLRDVLLMKNFVEEGVFFSLGSAPSYTPPQANLELF
jgi:hypothetical protein